MSVLATDTQLRPGRNIFCGEKGPAAPFDDFFVALEKVFLRRTRFAAAMLASMLKLASRAICR
jgi:hypothetical protein